MKFGKAPTLEVHEQLELPLRADGGLRVVVVADTHSEPHPKSSKHIAAQRPDVILHAGDIGDLKVLDDLRKLAPTHAVRGNIDGRGPGLPDTLDVFLTAETGPGQKPSRLLSILLLHIAVNGPRLRADVARLAEARAARLVICGHSHVPFIGRDRGIGIFNPGSIGPRRFSLPIVFGVLELRDRKVELWHVSAETGERWAPPS